MLLGYCHASEMYANDMKDLMMQCVPWNGVAGFCFEAIQVLYRSCKHRRQANVISFDTWLHNYISMSYMPFNTLLLTLLFNQAGFLDSMYSEVIICQFSKNIVKN